MFSLEKYIRKITKRAVKSILKQNIRTKNGYIKKRKIFCNSKFEHREVAERILGRKLSDEEIVHHIDFIRDNNSPSNLCVMNKKNHKHYHNWHRWMEKNKPGIKLTIEYRKKKLLEKWNCILLG